MDHNLIEAEEPVITGVPEIDRLIRDDCCKTCGFPSLVRGPLCPACEEKVKQEYELFSELMSAQFSQFKR